MKKNILLILLSSAFLTGCELDISIQRFFGLIKEEPQQEQKEEENHENSQENPQENEESNNHEGGEQGGNEQKPETNEDEYTATISTYGSDISGFATKAGVQVDSELSSGANNANNLTKCLKAQLGHEECLTSAWYEKINTAEWDSKCIVQIGTGNPTKDNFNPGTFKWTSSAKIYRVEITAQCYAKPPYSEDSDAKIKIDDGTAQALKVGEELEFQTISKEYEDGTNSFTIQSIDGRVLLKALKITWRL